MNQLIIPVKFSVIAMNPSKRSITDLITTDQDASAMFTIGFNKVERAHFFRDLITGTSLFLASNRTFQLNDPAGYSSGTVLAQQMVFDNDDVSVWHQDQRFSFTCQANHKTGFCFGWLIDRMYSKSYRVLDPGKAG